MPQVKPIDSILAVESYANDKKVLFRITTPDRTTDPANDTVEVPISIVYRLFHLGRAYDFPTIKQIHPGGTARIDYVHLPLLTVELEHIYSIVNDPVAHHYLGLLIPLLKSRRHDTKSSLLVASQ
jgi:hypothetical protein